MTEKILIAFSDFDPVSENLLNLVDYASKELNIQKVVFFYQRNFEQESVFTKEERIIFLNAALQNHKECEYIIDGNSFSQKAGHFLDALTFFKKVNKDSEIFWVTTSKQYKSFKEDERFHLAMKLIHLVVYMFPAEKEELFEQTLTNGRTVFLNENKSLCDFSEDSIFSMKSNSFCPLVLNYINSSPECAIKRIKSLQNYDRFRHSLRVAGTVKYICELSGIVDKDTNFWAYLAALYHDICKNFARPKQVDIAKKILKVKYYPDWKVLHGLVGCWYMKNQYFFQNEEVLNAVKHHTIPPQDCSLVTKIVHLADRLELEKKDDFQEGEYQHYWDLIQDKKIDEAFQLMRQTNLSKNPDNKITYFD